MSANSQGPTESDLKPVGSVTSGSTAIPTLNLPDSKKTSAYEGKNSIETDVAAGSTDG